MKRVNNKKHCPDALQAVRHCLESVRVAGDCNGLARRLVHRRDARVGVTRHSFTTQLTNTDKYFAPLHAIGQRLIQLLFHNLIYKTIQTLLL